MQLTTRLSGVQLVVMTSTVMCMMDLWARDSPRRLRETSLDLDIYFSSVLSKIFSFSCWALMKASLNRLASARVSVYVVEQNVVQTLTLSVAESNRKSLRLWLAFRHISCGIPHPAAVASNVWRELHVRNDCTSVSILLCCSFKHQSLL